MITTIKRFLIGSPLPSGQLSEVRLSKLRALAAFSPDALSSIAYANQEIFLGLVLAGSAGLSLSWPVGLTIGAVLLLVAISYFQTIHAYPSGGGSYIVARENLGISAGLLAAGALLIDYVLTAAVSLTAGVAALTSAFPELLPYQVPCALVILLIITIINLRGIQETGTAMAIPVYLFLGTFISMLLYGSLKAIINGPGIISEVSPPATQSLSLLLILRAFSSGCTALTGIEAISNGVPVFQRPEARNAGRTLIVMALLMGLLFIGSIGLTQYLAVVPSQNETVLSALARRLLGTNPAYYLVQVCTMLILSVAANTSFVGFPRIAAILARDGYLPHAFQGIGDRLVYQNGMLFLSVLAGSLIVGFGGDTHALVPLFAVGAFLAFTLSQSGMVVHWLKLRNRHWKIKAGINGVGALVTRVTLLVVGVSKFTQGAWLTILIIPLIVGIFKKVELHYRDVANQLVLPAHPSKPASRLNLRVVVPISGVHRGDIHAMEIAQAISDHVTGVYIELEPGTAKKIIKKWTRWWPEIPLVIVPSPFRSLIGPLLEFLDKTDAEHNDGQLAAVVLPEFIPARWWHGLLHNQTAWLIKTALLYRRRHHGFQRVIIDVPLHLER